MTIRRFELNGATVEVDLPDGMPLLWALRDVLGLTGTKYGCGRMLCGACTVHVDGKATRTCQLPIERIAGKRVTTIEGLSRDSLHPLQRAWIAESVPQCGYCQSGQIMTAAALLAEKPVPNDGEVNTAMSGVLCRCGTYQRIRRAIHRAARDR